MKLHLKKPFLKITVFFIIIKLCLHLFTFKHHELHRDEMLYFHQGDHLGFGNATVPPFIGRVAFLIKTLFGYSVFGIRLIPMVLGALLIASPNGGWQYSHGWPIFYFISELEKNQMENITHDNHSQGALPAEPPMPHHPGVSCRSHFPGGSCSA